MSFIFGLRCPDCGKSISDDDSICPHCGTNLDAPITKADEYPQKNTDESSNHPAIDWNLVDENIIIRRQWTALILFFFFNFAALSLIIYTITAANSFTLPELAGYSCIAAYLSIVYISLSSIKNRISIARRGGGTGLWEYTKGTLAMVVGGMLFIIAALYAVVVLHYFFGINFFL